MSGVLYFAPGAGLGHLNRALAVCLSLRERGVAAEIVTNSPFAEGVARASRVAVTRIRSAQWARAAPRYAAARAGDLLVLDTFPFGLRGEWSAPPPELRIVYVARRLRLGNYNVEGDWRRLDAILVAEPLDPDHEQALPAHRVRLPGLIRLAPGTVPARVPAPLQQMLGTGRAWLVIHTGPPEEVRSLVELARARMPPGDPLALISPWRVDGAGCPCFECFPAGNLIARAAHVVSGGGYNIVADMMFDHARHTAIAFPRRYDDQAARLFSFPDRPADGTAAAADHIAGLLRNGFHTPDEDEERRERQQG